MFTKILLANKNMKTQFHKLDELKVCDQAMRHVQTELTKQHMSKSTAKI